MTGTLPPPWPLAGTPGFTLMDAQTRGRLAAWLRCALEQDVCTTWFERSVDRERGGFLPDLDRRWRPEGPQDRMLEFQARQARSAARLAMALPSQDRWPGLALHGFRYLRDTLWDHQHGGWYWLLDTSGTPRAGGSKHSHGTAYAIGACVEIYRATGEREALALAHEGLAWLERAFHDEEHGGYYGWVRRDGTPILTVADTPDGRTITDPLGHGVGHKDINVTSDLFEMFIEFHAHLPSALTEQRLRELRAGIARSMTPDGALHYAVHPNWTPIPGPERYGYHLLSAYRFALAGGMPGASQAEGLELARCLARHTLVRAGLKRGGLAEAGPGSPPERLSGQSLVVPSRVWWVQLEGLRVMLLLAVQDHPSRQEFAAALESHLAFIDRECRDHRHGGWYEAALGDRPWHRRLPLPWNRAAYAKGSAWKDGSHEADTYLAGLRMVRGLPLDAPLED